MGFFYITYIQGRFRIYCKAALCWGVGAKGEVGFEVDGSSFAAFYEEFYVYAKECGLSEA